MLSLGNSFKSLYKDFQMRADVNESVLIVSHSEIQSGSRTETVKLVLR